VIERDSGAEIASCIGKFLLPELIEVHIHVEIAQVEPQKFIPGLLAGHIATTFPCDREMS
jgi:adenine deaminase